MRRNHIIPSILLVLLMAGATALSLTTPGDTGKPANVDVESPAPPVYYSRSSGRRLHPLPEYMNDVMRLVKVLFSGLYNVELSNKTLLDLAEESLNLDEARRLMAAMKRSQRGLPEWAAAKMFKSAAMKRHLQQQQQQSTSSRPLFSHRREPFRRRPLEEWSLPSGGAPSITVNLPDGLRDTEGPLAAFNFTTTFIHNHIMPPSGDAQNPLKPDFYQSVVQQQQKKAQNTFTDQWQTADGNVKYSQKIKFSFGKPIGVTSDGQRATAVGDGNGGPGGYGLPTSDDRDQSFDGDASTNSITENRVSEQTSYDRIGNGGSGGYGLPTSDDRDRSFASSASTNSITENRVSQQTSYDRVTATPPSQRQGSPGVYGRPISEDRDRSFGYGVATNSITESRSRVSQQTSYDRVTSTPPTQAGYLTPVYLGSTTSSSQQQRYTTDPKSINPYENQTAYFTHSTTAPVFGTQLNPAIAYRPHETSASSSTSTSGMESTTSIYKIYLGRLGNTTPTTAPEAPAAEQRTIDVQQQGYAPMMYASSTEVIDPPTSDTTGDATAIATASSFAPPTADLADGVSSSSTARPDDDPDVLSATYNQDPSGTTDPPSSESNSPARENPRDGTGTMPPSTINVMITDRQTAPSSAPLSFTAGPTPPPSGNPWPPAANSPAHQPPAGGDGPPAHNILAPGADSNSDSSITGRIHLSPEPAALYGGRVLTSTAGPAAGPGLEIGPSAPTFRIRPSTSYFGLTTSETESAVTTASRPDSGATGYGRLVTNTSPPAESPLPPSKQQQQQQQQQQQYRNSGGLSTSATYNGGSLTTTGAPSSSGYGGPVAGTATAPPGDSPLPPSIDNTRQQQQYLDSAMSTGNGGTSTDRPGDSPLSPATNNNINQQQQQQQYLNSGGLSTSAAYNGGSHQSTVPPDSAGYGGRVAGTAPPGDSPLPPSIDNTRQQQQYLDSAMSAGKGGTSTDRPGDSPLSPAINNNSSQQQQQSQHLNTGGFFTSATYNGGGLTTTGAPVSSDYEHQVAGTERPGDSPLPPSSSSAKQQQQQQQYNNGAQYLDNALPTSATYNGGSHTTNGSQDSSGYGRPVTATSPPGDSPLPPSADNNDKKLQYAADQQYLLSRSRKNANQLIKPPIANSDSIVVPLPSSASSSPRQIAVYDLLDSTAVVEGEGKELSDLIVEDLSQSSPPTLPPIPLDIHASLRFERITAKPGGSKAKTASTIRPVSKQQRLAKERDLESILQSIADLVRRTKNESHVLHPLFVRSRNILSQFVSTPVVEEPVAKRSLHSERSGPVQIADSSGAGQGQQLQLHSPEAIKRLGQQFWYNLKADQTRYGNVNDEEAVAREKRGREIGDDSRTAKTYKPWPVIKDEWPRVSAPEQRRARRQHLTTTTPSTTTTTTSRPAMSVRRYTVPLEEQRKTTAFWFASYLRRPKLESSLKHLKSQAIRGTTTPVPPPVKRARPRKGAIWKFVPAFT